MATFHFELVSPERLLFAGEVTQVDVPGEAGDFGVLAGHAPYIATLKPGILTIFVTPRPSATPLAHRGARRICRGRAGRASPCSPKQATPVSEIDGANSTRTIKDAEEDVADAETDAARDKARTRLDQFRALKDMLAT